VDEISTSNAADEAAEIMGIACKLGHEGIIAKRLKLGGWRIPHHDTRRSRLNPARFRSHCHLLVGTAASPDFSLLGRGSPGAVPSGLLPASLPRRDASHEQAHPCAEMKKDATRATLPDCASR